MSDEILGRYGIGKSYRGLQLQHSKSAFVASEVSSYLERLKTHVQEGTGLLFQGAGNTGKSALASIICREAILKHYYPAYFMSLDDLLLLDNARWKMKQYQEEYSKKVEKPKILVLDDVPFVSNKAKSPEELIKQVLAKRLRENNVTIFTTKSLKNIKEPIPELMLRKNKIIECTVEYV